MKVACIQLRSGTRIDANIAAAETLIREAASVGATLVATPEMTHLLQRSAKDLFAAIQPEDKDLGVARFSALAAELEIDLLIGSMAIQVAEDKAANRAYLFGPDGAVKVRYDKIHLFDVAVSETEIWTESRIYLPGSQAAMNYSVAAKLGLSICYDLRFPSLYRSYAQNGAHILMVPAAFTRPTGEAHWETLLRARAIETGAFIMAPAQGGKHEDGRRTWGRSMIVNPWGEIVTQLDHDQPGFIIADIDLNDVSDARSRIPAWQHNPDYAL